MFVAVYYTIYEKLIFVVYRADISPDLFKKIIKTKYNELQETW